VHGQGELPGEVDPVLDAGVHALRAGRRVDVRGVAGDEDPPVAVAVGQPVADPEHRGPAQVVRPGRLGGQPVEHRLDVAQLRSPAALDPVLHLTRRSGRQLLGDQHRHPIPPRTRQRDAHQYVVDAPVGLVHRPHPVPIGHGPVHLDVTEHVLLGKRVSGELDPKPLAHPAVRAVGPHQVGDPRALLARRSRKVRGDAVGVLFEADQLDTPLNPAAQLP
jgi:hypothetical protein